jgi:DNA-binding transcriptional regulator YiaG
MIRTGTLESSGVLEEASQAVFAQVLNISTKAVQSWDTGARRPEQRCG